MERFAITGYGEPQDVFETITANPRELTAGHIRVAVKAFAINPYDVSLRSGAQQENRSLTFPYVLGNDAAGIVTEVFADETDFSVGDRVVIHPISGTYGEEVVLPNKKAAKIPDQMSFAEAAGMVTTGITAYNLLFQLLKIDSKKTVMVLGASGGVGSLLVQLLHQNGNFILASARKENAEKVRAFGADEFVPYDTENPGDVFFEQADVVIDATKGSKSSETGLAILKPGGTYVALNDLPSEDKRKEGVYLGFAPQKDYLDHVAFDYLLQTYAAGNLVINIAEILPFQLSSVMEAHEKIAGHPTAGKIVIAK
ncbi:NADP-dependent oxidoreductase [Enterococcus dispar]|jgi:NADPH:quinone reductase-like Zn-dependent oxidoreductase|uniref:NADP-dependent oxidoreductase n=1 Tax=Enterococcus dispar TaxID=44009 RepID=UPI0021D44AD6|nr:NADP-dependent oxidoreductase [Enterococcus dispar]MCU7356748.1 NADP-dependent oxidoreductase [Enterococcus dispar]MDT2706743.1 NADP-dependent oxidoreductase [Enterococcus dispar]